MIWRLAALVAGALAVLCAALLFAHQNPGHCLQILLQGSLGSPAAIGDTLRETTPLLIAGLAVFVGLRAGLFNIGVDGQLVCGAAACTEVALHIPNLFGMLLGIACGMAAGALWALPAGLIKAYRNGHEVITTIMLNNVAGFVTYYMVSGPIKDPAQQDTITPNVPDATRLPWIYHHPPVQVNVGLLVGIVAAVGMALWLKRTVAGYELQAVGANATAAKFAGIATRRVMVSAMCVSGGIAGLAGAVEVLAYRSHFSADFSPGYGFDALGVALLCGSNAYGLLPSSLLFGILSKGGTSLSVEGVPKGITGAVLGFLILIAAVIRYRKVTTVA